MESGFRDVNGNWGKGRNQKKRDAEGSTINRHRKHRGGEDVHDLINWMGFRRF